MFVGNWRFDFVPAVFGFRGDLGGMVLGGLVGVEASWFFGACACRPGSAAIGRQLLQLDVRTDLIKSVWTSSRTSENRSIIAVLVVIRAKLSVTCRYQSSQTFP